MHLVDFIIRIVLGYKSMHFIIENTTAMPQLIKKTPNALPRKRVKEECHRLP